MPAGDDRRENILLVIACSIVAIWIIGVAVQVIFPSHIVPPEVHGIVFVVVSGLFGSAALSARSRKGNGNGN